MVSKIENMSQQELVELISRTLEYAKTVKRSGSVVKKIQELSDKKLTVPRKERKKFVDSPIGQYSFKMPMIPYPMLDDKQKYEARMRFYKIYGTAKTKYNVTPSSFAYAVNRSGKVSQTAPLHPT